MRTSPTVGPKPLLLSRPRVIAELAMGLRARVHPTGKFPLLAPLEKISNLGRVKVFWVAVCFGRALSFCFWIFLVGSTLRVWPK